MRCRGGENPLGARGDTLTLFFSYTRACACVRARVLVWFSIRKRKVCALRPLAPRRDGSQTGGRVPLTPELVTVGEVARALRVGRSLAHRLCTDGSIPSARVLSVGSRRGRVVVKREDLDAYIDALFSRSNAKPANLDVDQILARVRRTGRG